MNENFMLIGYTYSSDNPEVVTGFILENEDSGIKFRASLMETMNLHKDNRLKVLETTPELTASY